MPPFISILIPVFNVEKYVERCIRSVLSQIGTANFEVIIYDDASQDNSRNIINNVMADYPDNKTIRLYQNKTNQGLASTRKKALRVARGQYIWYVDSDDWIEGNCLNLLAIKLQKHNFPDILFFDFVIENNYGSHAQSMAAPVDPSGHLDSILRGSGNASLCNKLIKKDLLSNIQNDVPNALTIGEDFCLSVLLLLQKPRMAYCPIALYHYNKANQTSMTHVADKNFFDAEIYFISIIDKILLSDSQRCALAEFKAKIKLQIISQKLYPRNEITILFPEIAEHIWEMKNIDFLYRVALYCFSGGLYTSGIFLVKTNFLLRKLASHKKAKKHPKSKNVLSA